MAFRIIRNDITKVRADAIVNTANPFPQIGEGTDSAIYTAAGAEKLLKAREEIGIIDRGQSAYTPGFDLTEKNGVKYIIHTVGIFYENGRYGERTILRSCYSNSLKMARRLGCKSIAFPLLAAGNYNFPKGMALDIAVEEIEDFLSEYEMDITLVVYDSEAYMFTDKFETDIQSFIDDNYIDSNIRNELHSTQFTGDKKGKVSYTTEQLKKIPAEKEESVSPANEEEGKKTIAPIDINAFVEQKYQSLDFKNKLQKIIADRGLANADVYKKTNIDRKYFSKIISPKNSQQVKKGTVIQLGLALELTPEEFDDFLASANYALNPSLKSDVIIKYCVMNKIYSIPKVDSILFAQNEPCFSDL